MRLALLVRVRREGMRRGLNGLDFKVNVCRFNFFNTGFGCSLKFDVVREHLRKFAEFANCYPMPKLGFVCIVFTNMEC